MAEFVNQRMENMLTELEQMKRIGLYTDDEVKTISKKRKDFEYRIRKHVKCKEDYLQYISYECVLLQHIRLRREKCSIKDKKGDIEFAIAKRVAQLYKDLTARFFDDIDIWLNFIEFCKNVQFTTMVTASLDMLTQVHGEKPKIWMLACRWEYEEMLSVKNAQKFILKGLQRHPDSAELYIDALRIELLIAENMKDDDIKEKQMERIKVILSNALKSINTAEFIINLIEIFQDFDFASESREQLFTLLWKEYKDRSETWNFIANRELQGKEVTGFKWTTLKEHFMSSQYPDNLNRFITVHEIGISEIKTKNSVSNFINGAVNLIETEDLTIAQILQIINRALELGHKLKLLNEHHYKLWIEILCSDSNTSRDEILQILDDACEIVPSSEFIWIERLKRNTANPATMFSLFKKARKAVPSDKKALIWNFVIENIRDISILKKMSEETMSLPQNVAAEVKPYLLKAFYNIGGVDSARSEYGIMATSPPFSLQLHGTMLDIEAKEGSDPGNAKRCHELSTQQFGRDSCDVWIRYVKFLIKHSPETCKLIHNRARSTLKDSLVNIFMSEYSEIINKN